MKPERLEMVGFAPFRSTTEVDFSGLELFALTGPTGAGKSSVIDAITFALYGVVARYDDKRSVEPVITLGAAEARIRFDFMVGDRLYTAARVVRRNPRGGASTAEARLESDGEVIASGSAEVTKAVESLLGLSITHFTRSVVLPQGDFASFLHDTPSGQQDLVKALLDLGVLERVRTLANERNKTAAALGDSARQHLDSLGDATEEAEKAAALRLEALESLTERVVAGEAAIAAAESAAGEKAAEVSGLQARHGLAATVSLPAGVTMLADSLTAANEAVATATKQLVDADETLAAAVERSESLPTRDRLEFAADVAKRLDSARARHADIDIDGLTRVLDRASESADAAAVARAQAQARHEDGRTRHAAHALACGLAVGDPCPVCHRALESEPGGSPPDLDEARQVLVSREAALTEATGHLRAAHDVLTRGQAEREAEAKAIESHQDQLSGLPLGDELIRLVAARSAVDAEMAAGVEAKKQAEGSVVVARGQIGDLEEAEKAAWVRFHAARDEVAVLGPPAAERSDLATAWDGLVVWAQAEAKQLLEAVAEAVEESEASVTAVETAVTEVALVLDSAQVSGTGSPSARLAGAVAGAGAALATIRERRRQRASLKADLAGFEEKAGVAHALGSHLRSANFEGWLLAEALATLVGGANGLLDDLSRGSYSLAVEGRTIVVVDHRNADERRSVRSLSGGETFLVSLALALSLGEQLINLSERGGARLDAIFLDEGFGTLDAETLDTVSAVVSELAAQGRVVGLVTHVKELAEQVPVRFEVRPGPAGSTIERIDG